MPGKTTELTLLQERTAQSDFWDDQQSAQVTLRRINSLQEQTDRWSSLQKEVDDLLELLVLAEDEQDDNLVTSLAAQTANVQARLAKQEDDLLLSRPYADHDAIVSIHAGAGGTESQDWAAMLLRMYLRYGQRHDFNVEVLDESLGEEAGIKSATLGMSGSHAYGYLESERGVHRLVRLSPFDAAKRRHTSFALVEVMPEVAQDLEVVIDEKDIRVDTFRSTGAGGQHVNKTDSAIRITHFPTGIVVTCQNERSQLQNREVAMRILKSRLLERQIEEREAQALKLRGEHVAAGWGNQIRSYVLHPYTMVKDHRTDHETGNTTAVLDGDLDGFMEAYLRKQVQPES